MIEYIKVVIISLISGLFAPLQFSHSAVYSYISYILDFNQNSSLGVFYYSIVSIGFSLAVFFSLRKIYFKGIRALFSGKNSKIQNRSGYRKLMLNLLISLFPAAVMSVPYSKDKILLDIFNDQLGSTHLLVTALCCAGSGMFLLIAHWYTKQNYDQTRRSADLKNIVRFSIYQLLAYFLPGVSCVSVGATGLLISDVDNRVIVREMLTYIAPSMLTVNIVRLVRVCISGIIPNPIMIVLCAVMAILGSALMIHLLSKIDFKKTCIFFSIFSIVFGIGTAVVLFVI